MSTWYFSSHSYYRYLLSSPTRRSSDLAVQGHCDEGREDHRRGLRPHRGRCERDHGQGAHLLLLEVPGHGSAEHHGPAARQDRKSTRLNSSHVAISYAVFCLKKKTKIRQ